VQVERFLLLAEAFVVVFTGMFGAQEAVKPGAQLELTTAEKIYGASLMATG
jgi:hypothetical protein